MKKKLSLLLTAVLSLSLLTGCFEKIPPAAPPAPPKEETEITQPETPEVPETPETALPRINFIALSGPTGVGAAQMLSAHGVPAGSEENAPADITVNYTIAATNDEVTPALINGEVDFAAVATNVAANLSAKTEGGVQVLCVNTEGVLYILEKGDTVHTIADLKGKTMYAPSNTKGANPEFILNHLLRENGVAPSEVDIQWITAQEITAKMTTEDTGICMLPVPAATAVLVKDSGVREAVSLTEAWNDLDQGPLPMGCVVVRTEYAENNPDVVEQFLQVYETSIEYMKDAANLQQGAQWVAQYGITANEAIATKAIPQCNLTYVTGAEMQEMLQNYYEILYQANPASIGGSMPYDSFYYGVE